MDEAGGVRQLDSQEQENCPPIRKMNRTETLPRISVLPHIRCRNLWIMTSS